MVTQTSTATGFEVGEEVVVRLTGLDVYSPRTAGLVPPGHLPAWAIARITLKVTDETSRYLLAFTLDRESYLCVAGEDAIEGTA